MRRGKHFAKSTLNCKTFMPNKLRKSKLRCARNARRPLLKDKRLWRVTCRLWRSSRRRNRRRGGYSKTNWTRFSQASKKRKRKDQLTQKKRGKPIMLVIKSRPSDTIVNYRNTKRGKKKRTKPRKKICSRQHKSKAAFQLRWKKRTSSRRSQQQRDGSIPFRSCKVSTRISNALSSRTTASSSKIN